MTGPRLLKPLAHRLYSILDPQLVIGHIYERDSAALGSLRSYVALPAGYLARPTLRDELARVALLQSESEKALLGRFDRGDLCYGVFLANSPVSVAWARRGSCFVRGLGYRVATCSPDDVYIYGVFTAAEERGRGIYRALLFNLMMHASQLGANRFIQLVLAHNAPVLHTLPRLGYHRTGSVSCIRMNRVRITLARCGRRRWPRLELSLRVPKGTVVI